MFDGCLCVARKYRIKRGQRQTQRILYLLDGFRVYPNRINVVRIYYVRHV